MKKVFYLPLFFICFFLTKGFPQNPEYKLQNYHPVSPSAFEFLKYTEMPVSEYTGVPDISIPLFEISEDGLKIPLSLTYHAGGIRVNQEASWVGLGWDLTIGSIVQEINDLDDYATYTTRKLPDWNTSPTPQNFPMRWQYPNTTLNGLGWSNPYPIQTPQALHSYMISTAYYVPFNGNFDDQTTGQLLFTSNDYDSEPDIFKANFLGHSLTFVRNWPNGNISVLNKKGYQITRTGDMYIIVVPSGEQFYFETMNTVESYSSTTGGIGGGGGSTWEPTSKIWMLTKIVSKNGREILFSYSQSSLVENYPNYSQKWTKTTQGVSNQYSIFTNCSQPNQIGYNELPIESETATTFSYSRETRSTLTSIHFPNGQIDFTTSTREDILGAKKLDFIQISSGQLIKSYQLNYSYLDASSVGGNVYQPYNAASFGTTNLKRLKLVSIQDNSGAAHSFYYDNTLLPPKNSLAQDFWGFYNGQLSNTSLIPNPARLNLSSLGDNGNNNSANYTYTKAGILTDISYPTGGKISFTYALNTFDNYWVPDFNSTTNQVSSGNGLRVQAITYKTDDNTIAKKTTYSYDGGKALTPIAMYRSYNFNRITRQYSYPTKIIYNTDFHADELNARGFFSTNALGSGSSVGYDKVISQDVDANNNANGRTENYYNNTPDVISNSAVSSSQLSATLPTRKNRDKPENGTLIKTLYYNNQNSLQKKVENSFVTYLSDDNSQMIYGARSFGYINLFFVVNGQGGSGCINESNWETVPQTLIGYYPIYDLETLISTTKTTEYGDDNIARESTIAYTYGNFNLLIGKMTKNGTGEAIYENYEHAYEYYLRTGNNLLINSHRLSEVTTITKGYYQITHQTGPHYVQMSELANTYSSFGNRVAISSISVKNQQDAYPRIVSFDQYDSYGNPLQSTDAGSVNSLIWDYNNEYVIAEIKNSDVASVAYTSFEADGKGNWTFTGTATIDNTALIGKKTYNLNGFTISKNNLNSSKTYIVNYWLKTGSGTCTVNGASGTSIVNKNGWTLYEIELPIGITSISISGTGTIDELKMFPKGSLMTTYAYSPLIGMTAQCNVNNQISYFAYDAIGRLTHIRDIDNNIIKKYCYNYTGQIEDCTSPIVYGNELQSQGFTRNNCGECSSGSQVTYTVPANVYTSTVSVVAANQLALNDIAANGQAYANANGTCTSTGVTITYQNETSATGFVALYTNNSTGQTYSFNVPASGSGTLGCVPAGIYSLSISKPGNMMLALFGSGCFTQSGTSAFFGKVNVSMCNTVIIGYDL